MVGTFGHVIKTDGVRGLYSGVRFSSPLAMALGSLEEGLSGTNWLISGGGGVIVISRASAPGDLLDDAVRHLRGTQELFHDARVDA